MEILHAVRWIIGVSLLCPLPVSGQEWKPVGVRPTSSSRGSIAEPNSSTVTGNLSEENQVPAPRLVKFTGVLTEFPPGPSSGAVEMTLALYKEEHAGEPLWTETQSVEVDKEGRYTVLLGAVQANGLPVELFASGEARWLEVEIQGQPHQPRALLVGVPYALKAVEAEMLGGKSVSDFVLSESLGEQVRQVIQAQGQVAPQSALAVTAPQKPAATSSATITTTSPSAAGRRFPPSRFSGTTTDQIVLVQQNGTGQGLAASTGLIGGNGVYGQTAGTNASGVFGNATSSATSSFQNGVLGVNAGAGSGVAGIGTNPSAGIGIYGQGANCCGIVGNAVATSGFNCGLCGDGSPSPNGSGVFGSAGQWVGVGGQATATSGVPAYGVWGDSRSTSGVGVAGYADATSGPADGVYGHSVSPNGIGVFGVNDSNTGNYNYGISGVNNATSGKAFGVAGSSNTTDFAGGVVGEAFATSGSAFGVFGQGASPNGFGLFGYESAPSGTPTAVFGMVESSAGIAGQFVDHSGSGLILQGLSGSNFNQVFSLDANGNLNISGNLTVRGTKSSTAKLQNGREVALYAVESPENWFEDFGSAELKRGVAWVPLDASFAEATNAAVSYHVFLTPNGDCNGLYVARKTTAGFEVREHGGAVSNVAFDYRIVVRRRGYETIRMAEVRGDLKTVEASRQHLAHLANSGALTKTGAKLPSIAPARIGPPSAVRRVTPQHIVPQVPKLSNN